MLNKCSYLSLFGKNCKSTNIFTTINALEDIGENDSGIVSTCISIESLSEYK